MTHSGPAPPAPARLRDARRSRCAGLVAAWLRLWVVRERGARGEGREHVMVAVLARAGRPRRIVPLPCIYPRGATPTVPPDERAIFHLLPVGARKSPVGARSRSDVSAGVCRSSGNRVVNTIRRRPAASEISRSSTKEVG